MKDILVFADGRPDCLAAIQVAAQLAHPFQARLTAALEGSVAEVPAMALHAGGMMLAEDLAKQKDRLREEIQEKVASLLAPLRESVEWVMMADRSVEALAHLSIFTDLVVMTFGDEFVTPSALAQFVIHSGRPVLVVPAGHPGTAVGKRVTIGWGGGRESSRAVHDALPLLRAAEAVELVIVTAAKNEPTGAQPGQTIAAHLARHGVAATVRLVTGDLGPGVDGALLSAAADHQSDMIVMGAFGAGRLREALLGGVTKSVLRQTRIPIYLSH